MIDERLTNPNPALAEQQRASFPGMAHWALTGPAGATCRECRFFEHRDRYSSSTTGFKGGELRAAPCAKFRSLMNGKQGAAVPNTAAACRHFDRAALIPARFARDARR